MKMCYFLSLPPSSQDTSYRFIYVFRNHIRVRSAEGTLTTGDSDVAVTFSKIAGSVYMPRILMWQTWSMWDRWRKY